MWTQADVAGEKPKTQTNQTEFGIDLHFDCTALTFVETVCP